MVPLVWNMSPAKSTKLVLLLQKVRLEGHIGRERPADVGHERTGGWPEPLRGLSDRLEIGARRRISAQEADRQQIAAGEVREREVETAQETVSLRGPVKVHTGRQSAGRQKNARDARRRDGEFTDALVPLLMIEEALDPECWADGRSRNRRRRLDHKPSAEVGGIGLLGRITDRAAGRTAASLLLATCLDRIDGRRHRLIGESPRGGDQRLRRGASARQSGAVKGRAE